MEASGWTSAKTPKSRAGAKYGLLGISSDELACRKLIFFQRPVAPLHPFPLLLLHLWYLQTFPFRVESCFEEVHF